jgi:hypothetical protein
MKAAPPAAPRSGPPPSSRCRADAGTGLIASFAAVVVFLAFLLFAVQLLVGLYATTSVTSAAFDGARLVAGDRVDHADAVALAGARQAGEARIRSELGAFGRTASIDWSGSTDQEVEVRVQGNAPRFLFPGLQDTLGTDHIDRTVRVRVEAWR